MCEAVKALSAFMPCFSNKGHAALTWEAFPRAADGAKPLSGMYLQPPLLPGK
jgi:hypothetical protein